MIHFNRSKFVEYWGVFAAAFNFRRHIGRLDSIDSIEDFVITRAAFISQKGLFGYVKTRMGTKYPEMYRDDVMMHSLNIAKMYVYAAALSDLTIWVVANVTEINAIEDAHRNNLAERIFKAGMKQNSDSSVTKFSADEAVSAFKSRIADIDWSGIAISRDVFTESPNAVMKWAPVSDNLKKYDFEFVTNSIRFSWNNVRRQFTKRCDKQLISEQLAPYSP